MRNVILFVEATHQEHTHFGVQSAELGEGGVAIELGHGEIEEHAHDSRALAGKISRASTSLTACNTSNPMQFGRLTILAKDPRLKLQGFRVKGCWPTDSHDRRLAFRSFMVNFL